MRHGLANGLRIVLQPDARVPLTTLNLWYHVGSKNEKQGQNEGQGEGEKQNDKQGNGGTGGQGQGRGGKPPEVDQKTAFKTERSKSALHAGKTLMQWKTQEEADKGESKLDYKKAVDAVKQGVSEAILSEQIPPGYHEAIKKYFDQVEVPKEKK